MRRHCKCGNRLPEGKWFCGSDCLDTDPVIEDPQETAFEHESKDNEDTFALSSFERREGRW